MPSRRCSNALYTAGIFVAGTASITLIKIIYQTPVENINGSEQYFVRLYFIPGFMFVGEVLCLVAYLISWAVAHRGRSYVKASPLDASTDISTVDEQAPLCGPQASQPVHPLRLLLHDIAGGKSAWRLLGLASAMVMLDICSSICITNAFALCDASIVQILRGISILFTMVMRRIFLKQRPTRWEIVGVVVAIVGLALVGLAAVLGADMSMTSPGLIAMGIALVVASQLFSTLYFVFSEKFMKNDGYPPLALVGVQGIIGVVLVFGVVCPIVDLIPGQDCGSVESYANTIYMLSHSVLVPVLLLVSAFSSMLINWCMMTMTLTQSAIYVTLLSSVRIASIWTVMVVVYYATGHRYGEPVTLYTILEVGGFAIVFLGTAIHNNLWHIGHKISCFKDPTDHPLTAVPCSE